MSNLPVKYAWLDREPGPKILVELLKLHGVHEGVGALDNPIILGWAKEVGLAKVYVHDSIAWCGLTQAVAAKRAGYEPVKDPLWARNWQGFGNPVPGGVPKLGDILIFDREYRDAQGALRHAGHVGQYVGEDTGTYHVLAGNQGDAVSIARIAKTRLIEARRCPWKIAQPANVRRVYLEATGRLSTGEA